MLLQIPDRLFREEMAGQGVDLPPAGEYAVGMVFLPKDPIDRIVGENLIVETIIREGQKLLGWRDVPVDPSRASNPSSR
jgi:glutamate synthase (NADPH/NADH) large chain